MRAEMLQEAKRSGKPVVVSTDARFSSWRQRLSSNCTIFSAKLFKAHKISALSVNPALRWPHNQ